MTTIAKNTGVQIDRFELAPFGTNAYILTCLKTGQSILVDAPGEAGKILRNLKESDPRYILMTHDHMDHVGALSEIKGALNIPVAVHADDAGGLPVPSDMQLNDGDDLSVGSMKIKVIHTPGHTPGSLCFCTGHFLIAGDTLFPGGPGKTGSPKNFQQILRSITGKIFNLPDDTLVLPGHGESTTVREAKQEYNIFSSRSHDPNLCGDVLWESS